MRWDLQEAPSWVTQTAYRNIRPLQEKDLKAPPFWRTQTAIGWTPGPPWFRIEHIPDTKQAWRTKLINFWQKSCKGITIFKQALIVNKRCRCLLEEKQKKQIKMLRNIRLSPVYILRIAIHGRFLFQIYQNNIISCNIQTKWFFSPDVWWANYLLFKVKSEKKKIMVKFVLHQAVIWCNISVM